MVRTVIHKSPQPEIQIYDYNIKDRPIIILSPRKKDNTQLLSYNFSERVDDLVGHFSFSIAGGDNNLFNEIKPMQVVKIFEGDKFPVFIGIIISKNLDCSMGNSGVSRSISFSGASIVSLIANFQLILDIRYINAIKRAATFQEDLSIRLSGFMKEGATLKQYLDATWNAFLEYTGVKVSKISSAPSNTAIYNMITQFIGSNFFEVGESEKLYIPINNSFINQNINTIVQIWRAILAQPVYELFSRVNKYGEVKVVARETPFSPLAWNLLPITNIKPEYLIDYSLNLNNNEVYSCFLAGIEGSGLSASEYVIANSGDTKKSGVSPLVTNEEKLRLYGFKLLEINFRGYKKGDNKGMPERMRELAKKMEVWFGRLDEMYSGSLTITNPFSSTEKMPSCGERIRFLGGEFYIKGAVHSFYYGGTPTISYEISRGGIYEKGVFLRTLSDLGKSGIELNNDFDIDFLNRISI